MKNKKGFTLVELLVVIGLLSIMGVTISISLNKNMKKMGANKEKEFNEKIIGAANLYASNSEDILTSLYEDKGYVLIKVKDLIDEGFVQDTLVNPATNENITGEESVRIELDTTGTLNVIFPVANPEGDYLQTQTIKVEYNSNKNNICFEGINTKTLRYINGENGSADASYLKENVNIKCDDSNVDTTNLGSYELKYDYQTKNNVWKQATRYVLVVDSTAPECKDIVDSTTWINDIRRIEVGCEDNNACANNIFVKTFSNAKTDKITIRDISNNKTDCTVNVYSDMTGPSNIAISKSPNTEWSSDSITLTGTAKDELSGIKYFQFSTNPSLTDISGSGTEISVTNDTISKTATINDSGEYTYYFYVQDLVKNITRSSSISVKIDKVTPSVSIKATKTGTNETVANNTWVLNGLDFTFTKGSENNTSSYTIKYCKDNDNTCIPNTAVTNNTKITSYSAETGEYYIRYQIISGAGKSSSIASFHAKVDTCSEGTHAEYGQYGSWGACSVSCGTGVRNRSRTKTVKSKYYNFTCGDPTTENDPNPQTCTIADTTKPTLSIVNKCIPTGSSSEGTYNSTTGCNNGQVKTYLSYSDNCSGIKTSTLAWASGNTYNIKNEYYTFQNTLDENTWQYQQYKGYSIWGYGAEYGTEATKRWQNLNSTYSTNVPEYNGNNSTELYTYVENYKTSVINKYWPEGSQYNYQSTSFTNITTSSAITTFGPAYRSENIWFKICDNSGNCTYQSTRIYVTQATYYGGCGDAVCGPNCSPSNPSGCNPCC